MNLCRVPRYAAAAALFVALSATVSSPVQAVGIKYRTAGAYVDRAGGQHPWSINDAHALVWDSQPYIPVGGVFVSKYAGTEATDANYQADIKSLEALKAKGITDIVLKMGKPITACDPAAVQKIIDYLDGNGFFYGVEFDDGPKDPLSGYLILPNKYKLDGPTDSATLTLDWPDVDSAMFVVVSKTNGNIVEQGGGIVREGKVTIKLSDPLSRSTVLLVYPHKTLQSASTGMGDLWTGFGEYRDRVLAFLKGVKFGTGLRFFLEPFTSKMDFTGDMANFIPDSPGFRLGFEGYLLQKHVHEGSLNSAWGMRDQVPTAEKAARLIPMWGSGYGLPYLYDRASAQFYGEDTSNSSYWRDMIDYRDMSTQEYMNTIADTIRKSVANVPIIFKAPRYHRLYANPFGMNGYDGLAADAYGTGDAPVLRTAGGIYSLAEESSKCTWFIVPGTQADAPGKSTSAYASEADMNGALNSLREVGCKGFFVDALLSETGAAQIDWLKAYKDKLSAGALADFKPNVINFPVTPATGAYVKHIAQDTWWLPTLRTGKVGDIGDGICSYDIAGETGSYIWSDNGARSITLRVGPSGLPTVDYPAKGALVDKKKGVFTLNLTDSPIALHGIEFDMLFPMETAQKCIDKLSDAIVEVEKQKGETAKAKMGLENAKSVLGNGQPAIANGMANAELTELLDKLGKDTWIEGEDSPTYNFDAEIAMPGASKGLVLSLDTDQAAPLNPYSAAFQFNCKQNTSYEIWIAGTPPSDASPASYSVDDVSWTPVAAMDGKADEYAPGLAWYKIGTVNAFAGNHTLRIRIDNRRQSDSRFFYSIDAVVLSPNGFKPNGISKP